MHVPATFEPLFVVEKSIGDFFEKQAAIARMTDDEKKWPAQVISELHKQLPFISKYDVDIDLERTDATSGTAFGSAMLRNKSGRVRAEEQLGKPGNKIRVPIVIEKRELKPFHTFELGGTIYPLTQDRLSAAMINPKLFDGAANPPKSPGIMDQLNPPFQQRQGFGQFSNQTPSALNKNGSAPSGLRKMADDMMGGGMPPGMPQPQPPMLPPEAAPPGAAPGAPQSQPGQDPAAAQGLPKQPGQPDPSPQQNEAAQLGPAQAAPAASDTQSQLEIPFGHEDWAEQFKGTTLYSMALEIQSKGGAQAIAKAKYTLEQQRASATQLEQQLLSTSQSQDNMAQAQAGPGEGEVPNQMPPGQIPAPTDAQGQPLSFTHTGQPKAASALVRALDVLVKEGAKGCGPRILHSGKGTPAMPGMPGKHKSHEGAVAAKLAPKEASLCAQIAGTINYEDFDRFNHVYADKDWKRFVTKSASVQAAFAGLGSQPILPVAERTKIAAQKAAAQRFDVVQLTPIKGGYCVKVSSAPDGMDPQGQYMQQDMAPEQAQQAFPPEMMQQADQQGAATTTNVQADVDPLVETPIPVTTFGLYKVMEAGTGRQIVGYVIPTLLDPRSGQAAPQALFVNGGQFAMQPQVLGNLVALSFNLPSSPRIRGLGSFWKSDGRSIIVTTPFEVMNEVNVEGRKYYAARDSGGQECQLVMVDQLKQPFAMPTGELAMPADWLFMPLDSPVKLEDGASMQQGGQMPMKQAQARLRNTQGTIRAWDNGCDLQGPVFAKVGSGAQSWVDGIFHLACAGVPQELAVGFLEKAASTKSAIDLYGLKTLSTYVDSMASDLTKQGQKLASAKLPRQYNLLKEAAAIPDATSVDAILSLNFVNQDNVDTFLENIPRLEEAACKLASLVLAGQLGLSQIPQTAAVRAMFALEDVIGSLKSLETHTV